MTQKTTWKNLKIITLCGRKYELIGYDKEHISDCLGMRGGIGRRNDKGAQGKFSSDEYIRY